MKETPIDSLKSITGVHETSFEIAYKMDDGETGIFNLKLEFGKSDLNCLGIALMDEYAINSDSVDVIKFMELDDTYSQNFVVSPLFDDKNVNARN